MPAEILRDREQDERGDASDPVPVRSGASATTPGGFADLATAAGPSLEQRMADTERDLGTARQERKTAGQEEVAALQRRKEGMAPVIAQTQEAIGQPMPPPPPPTVLPQPPSRGLHEFLAPVEGEQPENTISKLIQGISLMATGFTGLARGDATAALASMKGALQGWQEGDKQRADRAFSDWKAHTDKLLAEADDRHRTYREIFEDKKLSVDQQLKLLELAGISHGHDIAIAAARHTTADRAVADLDKDYQHLLTVVDHANKTKSMEIEKREGREWEEKMIRLRAGLKADAKQQDDEAAAMTDAEMETLAQLEMSGGRPPSFGMGKSAERLRYLKVKARVAGDLGGPAAVQARLALISGLKAEQTKVMTTRGLVEAFSKTAEKNLKDAQALSETLDRDNSPMLNKWLLKGRKAWSGEKEVADFDVAVRTAINEVARVLNSANASGVISDTARHEIEDMLNTALNKEQFTAAVKRLSREMDNRRTSYDDQVKILNQQIKDAAAITPKTAPAVPAGWKIERVK